MATNRYTNITPSQFQPLSLQEIMLVPTLKRQQHDASLKGMEQFRSNLLKADPHKKYQEEVLKIQNEINSEIDSEIERLNREGFNPSTRANLSKLNRKVNDLLAPTGRLGQINAHKKALNETYKNYLEESIKAGNSPEIAKYHADQALAKHMQDPLYDEQGNVISFNIGAAPAFVDFDKFVFDAAKMAGMDERHWANASSYLDFDENSNRYVVNESAKGLNANNYAGLQAVVTYINNTLKDKSSPLRRSMDYNLRNIDNLSILGKNITDIHRSSKSGITDRSSSKSNVDWAEREEESGFDFLMNEEEYSPNEFTSRSYIDNVNRYRDLTSGRTLTIEEERELVNLEEFLENVEDKLAEDKNYQRLKTERDAKINALGLNENVAKWLKSQLNDDVTSQGLLSNAFTPDKLLETLYGSAINPHLHPDYKEGDYQKIRNFLRSDETQKNMEKIASEYNKQGHIKTTGYQLLPTTTKEKSEWAIVNHNFEKALKANPENLLNYLNIESVNMQDGLRRESSELDETDLKRIKELFNKSEDGSLEVVSFSTKGKSGKPEYVLKINTTKDNKVDLNRFFRFGEKGQGTLGGGVPVYLRVSYDHTKGDVLETANGYLQKYLIGKGRKDPNTKRHHGTELALDIEANRVKSRLNKQYSESGVTWGVLINEDTDFREIDPFVNKELSKRLEKYYENENPSDSEIKEAIRKFLKDNQNRLIYLR